MDIVARAKGLILRPAEEWRIIAAEPADTKSLFTSYAIPMSAIPAVAGFIGMAIFAGIFGGALGGALGVQIGIFATLLHSIAGYVLGLVGIWIWGKIIEVLAPRFGGVADETAAMKLAVYSPTAAWLAGGFAILPPLAILTILGLYSFYIFWKGVPVVLRLPAEKVLPFTLTVIVVGIVVNVVVGMFAALFLRF